VSDGSVEGVSLGIDEGLPDGSIEGVSLGIDEGLPDGSSISDSSSALL